MMYIDLMDQQEQKEDRLHRVSLPVTISYRELCDLLDVLDLDAVRGAATGAMVTSTALTGSRATLLELTR